MKFQGSAKIKIKCSTCKKESPSFRVYLYDEHGESLWQGKLPDGWTVGDEECFYESGDTLDGGCPEHPVDAWGLPKGG